MSRPRFSLGRREWLYLSFGGCALISALKHVCRLSMHGKAVRWDHAGSWGPTTPAALCNGACIVMFLWARPWSVTYPSSPVQGTGSCSSSLTIRARVMPYLCIRWHCLFLAFSEHDTMTYPTASKSTTTPAPLHTGIAVCHYVRSWD